MAAIDEWFVAIPGSRPKDQSLRESMDSSLPQSAGFGLGVAEPVEKDAPQRARERTEPRGFHVPRLPSLNFYQALFWAYIGIALTIFTVLVPPFQKADEVAHFHRAVSLTNLDIVCKKDENGVPNFPMKRKYADLPDVLHVWDVAFIPNARFDPQWLHADFSGPQFQETGRIYLFCNLPVAGYV